MDDHKKKILIIEDDEHVAQIYDIKFSKEGYETIIASNGDEGIKMMKDQKPDLVILDIMMPRKDGFMVLEEVKADPEISKIPVLAISNLGQESDGERALALGAREYLIKVSYSMQEVLEKAKKYL